MKKETSLSTHYSSFIIHQLSFMDYATKNHFGKNNHSQRAKTKRTAPTVGRNRRLAETPERHERNTERRAEIRSCEPSSNDFLKCQFLPKLKENYWQEQNQEKAEKTERDFYKSLSRLAKHYAINPMNTTNFEFPYNIALALNDVQNQLKNKTENWQERVSRHCLSIIVGLR